MLPDNLWGVEDPMGIAVRKNRGRRWSVSSSGLDSLADHGYQAWRNSMNSESKTVTPSFIVQNLLSEYLPAASTVLNSMFDRGLFAVADFNDDHKAAACRYSIFEKGFMEAIGLKACKSCGHRIEPDVARYKKALEAVRKETECDLTVRLRSVSDMEVLKNIWNQLANGHSTRWLLPSFATAYIVHTRSLRFDSLSKAADGIWEDIWLRLDDPTTLFFIQNRDSFLEVRC